MNNAALARSGVLGVNPYLGGVGGLYGAGLYGAHGLYGANLGLYGAHLGLPYGGLHYGSPLVNNLALSQSLA